MVQLAENSKIDGELDIWGLSRLIQGYGLGRRNKITAVQLVGQFNTQFMRPFLPRAVE